MGDSEPWRLLRTSTHRDSQLFCATHSMIGAIIIRVAYGVDVEDKDSVYIRIADRAMDCFNVVFQPGRYLVQTFPWMRHIPAWCPGAGFQREFNAWRPTVRSIHDIPWAAAMEAKVRGRALAPFAGRLAHASPRT